MSAPQPSGETRGVSATACGIDHEVARVPLANQPQEPGLTPSGSTATACTDRGGRGCPCPFHTWRRDYNRAWAAQRRASALAARQRSATTCPKRYGRHGVCGGVLESDIIGGKLVVTCPLCERFARGICRDCPRPVAGTPRKARRCAVHTEAARTAALRKYKRDNAETLRRKARRFARRPAVRADRSAYKKAWRKSNRDKVKAQKRRANLRGYGQQYQAERRARGIVAKPSRRALRTCLTPGCRIMLTGRKKKCTRCKEREAREALQALASRRRAA